jgi:hypothetical protein
LVLCGGEKVDAEHFFTEKLEDENKAVCLSALSALWLTCAQVADLQAAAVAQPKYRSFGFITFKSLVSTTKARQVGHCCYRLPMLIVQTIHSKTPHEWQVEAAPEIRDIIWTNLEMKFSSKTIRYLSMMYDCLCPCIAAKSPW